MTGLYNNAGDTYGIALAVLQMVVRLYFSQNVLTTSPTWRTIFTQFNFTTMFNLGDFMLLCMMGGFIWLFVAQIIATCRIIRGGYAAVPVWNRIRLHGQGRQNKQHDSRLYWQTWAMVATSGWKTMDQSTTKWSMVERNSTYINQMFIL